MQQQMNFLDSLCGKMSPEPSAATKAKTSSPSSRPSVPSETNTLMFLDQRMGFGNLLGAYWETTTVLPGEFWMPSTSPCRKGAKESTLSQILQLDAPEKYSLSPTACAGIIRRAEKRGKELPDMLKDALMEVIGRAGGMEQIAEEPEEELTDEDEEQYEDDE